jgi:hypothetical protein
VTKLIQLSVYEGYLDTLKITSISEACRYGACGEATGVSLYSWLYIKED